MTAELLASDSVGHAAAAQGAWGTRLAALRSVSVAAGIASALLFVALGPAFELQLYGDGSVFSYAIAVRDAWTIHWHNIPGRLFVYLFCFVPAETFVAWTGNPRGGIVLYGLLRDGAPLLGLAATFATDRSYGRVVFTCACLSTACVGPLVFGFPTEMWIAHALFWPALAASHYARGLAGTIAVFALLLALALTHEGALVLEGVILATLLLRGVRDPAFMRGTLVIAAVAAIWLAVKTVFQPDPYIVDVMADAEWNFFNPRLLAGDLLLLLIAVVAGYGTLSVLLRRPMPRWADIVAGVLVAVVLGAYWLWFDRSLHTQDRYFLRTVVLLASAGLGVIAATGALAADGVLTGRLARLSRLVTAAAEWLPVRAIMVAAALVMLVHTVETAKFLTGWSAYKNAVRTLAMGKAADPSLGDGRFVSSARIGDALNRLSWSSTTPYLSILLAPQFAPARLVVDPDGNYFWLSCAAAKANEAADRAMPVESRRLIRVLECLHRP